MIEKVGYDSERDVKNPTGSVFCSHGAGFTVSWDQVKDYMHLDSQLNSDGGNLNEDDTVRQTYTEEEFIDTEEIDRIIEQTYFANRKQKSGWKKKKLERTIEDYKSSVSRAAVKKTSGKKYLLVDGYNIIFAWDDLRELAKANIDAARGKLLDIMSNYQGLRKCELIVVFDAYRVAGHDTEILDYHNIHVVYTKEAETADQYIEKFAHEHGRKYDVTVATSDGLEQIIIRGQGCSLLSARELLEEVNLASQKLREEYLDKQKKERRYLLDSVSEEEREKLRNLKETNE